MQTFSQLLGSFNSVTWITILAACAISLYYPRNKQRLPKRGLLFIALVGVIIWRTGLLITSYALPFIDRGDMALYIRLVDAFSAWIFILWFALVARQYVRVVRS